MSPRRNPSGYPITERAPTTFGPGASPQNRPAVLYISKLSDLHRSDQTLDTLVDGAERVLAQHRSLRLIVELEVNPVDCEVPACCLGCGDEVAPQFGARGLRRILDGVVDRFVLGDPLDQALALENVEDTPAAFDVVVRQVELRDLGIGQIETVTVL